MGKVTAALKKWHPMSIGGWVLVGSLGYFFYTGFSDGDEIASKPSEPVELVEISDTDPELNDVLLAKVHARRHYGGFVVRKVDCEVQDEVFAFASHESAPISPAEYLSKTSIQGDYSITFQRVADQTYSVAIDNIQLVEEIKTTALKEDFQNDAKAVFEAAATDCLEKHSKTKEIEDSWKE